MGEESWDQLMGLVEQDGTGLPPSLVAVASNQPFPVGGVGASETGLNLCLVYL